MEGMQGWVRNAKQFGEARLSVFRPGESRTSGHIQTKCNLRDWRWVGITQVTCPPNPGWLLLDSPSQEQSATFHRADVPDAASFPEKVKWTLRENFKDIKEPEWTNASL